MAVHRFRAAQRRAWLLAAVIVATLGVCAAAFAYFTASGSGAGAATSGTMTIQINSVTVSSALAPGISSNVVVNVTNPNSFAVTPTAITSGPITASSGCTTPSVTFAAGTLPSSIPTGTSNITLTSAAAMGSDASSNCQGATFTIPLTIAVKH